ncbi:hypothetical protein PEC730217_26610 [Pectobacterium carotovorum subsp. carotovorum]|uniref:Uncharacterized protein n=1 Tax=Pectobacterium parmentieri TaxID=1905730 RepID=A0A0H3I321_PECPM|nr:Hypothetical protein W5S_1667 [Pectobacterium parmentieri]ASN84974.1 Hypothetical protein SCC1_1535 [Pectobacterium versatile]GKW33881.1 hypothetical protein PEC730217_26610 [Pectobacterium carotovorum subsp. carotovorum]
MAISKSSNSLIEDQHLKHVKRYFNLFWQQATEVCHVR